MIKKVFGERLAVTELTETLEGSIVMPPGFSAAGTDYRIGQIIEVGDGVLWNGKTADILFEVGQLVLFQIPQKIADSTTFRIPRFNENRPFALVHQGDVIGILTKPVVSMETFQIAGNFVLGKIFENPNESIIALPDNAVKRLTEFRIQVVQVGTGIKDAPYEAGDEIFPDRSRCNPIVLNDTEYLFVDVNNIFGVAAEKPVLPDKPEAFDLNLVQQIRAREIQVPGERRSHGGIIIN